MTQRIHSRPPTARRIPEQSEGFGVFVSEGTGRGRARAVRWPLLVLAVPLVPLLAILVVAASTAWHAVSVVRPPRLGVDSSEIERELPDSEPVSFLAPDGITLSGNFVPPKNGAVIVLVHGLFANRRQLLPEAQLFAAHGYGVLIYDNRAHGDSGGSTATWGQLESEDARTAVDFVQQRTHVPAGKVGLFGFSIGGTAVLREAIADPRIGATVVESTYSSMGGEIEYMFSRYGPFSKLPALWTARLLGGLDYSQLVPDRLVCSLNSRPLLLVYGSDDSDVPASEGRRMASAACSPTSLVVIQASTHGGFMEAEGSRYAEALLAFFDRALLAPPSSV
jgi:uncharacterized protein